LVEGVDAACRHWQLKHEEEGFLLSSTQRKNGFMLMIGGIMILIGITYARVSDTFAHGHSNVLFLLALTVVAIVVMYRFGRPATRLTARGAAYLKRLQSTLAPSRRVVPQRASASALASASPSELPTASFDSAETTDAHQPRWSPMASAALVPVALYGIAALPGSEQREMTHLFPQADPKKADHTSGGSGGGCGTSSACGSATSSSSWFSSDSSSSSDSGGSGCGGSGCGGGGGGD
jgi:hypothetical protein